MPLGDLSDQEREVVFACLECVATGVVIHHDWEFQIAFGVSVEEFLMVVASWPHVDDADIESVASLSINNAMNNLLGYPHEYHDRWEEVIAFPKAEVRRILRKWRGDLARGYFGNPR